MQTKVIGIIPGKVWSKMVNSIPNLVPSMLSPSNVGGCRPNPRNEVALPLTF